MEPDLDGFWDVLSGAYGWEAPLSLAPTVASGLIVGSNPPYGVADFLSVYPKFAGNSVSVAVTVTTNSTEVDVTDSGITSTPAFSFLNSDAVLLSNGISAGQLIVAPGLPAGTVITGVSASGWDQGGFNEGAFGGSLYLTVSLAATATQSTRAFVFTAAFIPMSILSMYCVLASASIMQQRWQSAWKVAMALYVAHFATLWIQSDGGTYPTAGSVASAGIAKGIQISKAVGDASVSYTLTGGLESWGAWQKTEYGQQLATMARVVGTGPIYVR